MSGKIFIDFRKLRTELDFIQVLNHYGIEIARQRGHQLTCHCPFHQDRRPSCSINTAKNIWVCHAGSCGLSGNVLDFVARCEGLDPDVGEDIRVAAEIALEIHTNGSPQRQSTPLPRDRLVPERPTPEAVVEEDRAPNAPLSFALKLADNHAMLKARGYKKSTYRTFGIGFCKRGVMKHRICFPIRNLGGELIGYAGRWPEEDAPNDQARYLLPAEFNKANALFGLERLAEAHVTHCVLVEGFWSVLRLYELGVPSVAVMGTHVFDGQIALLKSAGIERVTLMLDGDDAGAKSIPAALTKLAEQLDTRLYRLTDGQSPDEADLDRFALSWQH